MSCTDFTLITGLWKDFIASSALKGLCLCVFTCESRTSAAVYIDYLCYIVSIQSSCCWYVQDHFALSEEHDSCGREATSAANCQVFASKHYCSLSLPLKLTPVILLSPILPLSTLPFPFSASLFLTRCLCRVPSNALYQWWGTDTELLPSIQSAAVIVAENTICFSHTALTQRWHWPDIFGNVRVLTRTQVSPRTLSHTRPWTQTRTISSSWHTKSPSVCQAA